MFDSANLDHRVDKATYKAEVETLREQLLLAQNELVGAPRFPVVVIVGGVEGAGKGESVNLLLEWLDPRRVQVYGFSEPSPEERERPPLWRYWRALPPKGTIGVFFGAWHTQPVVGHATGELSEAAFEAQISDLLRFERMLCDEGVLLLKFWFHLTKKQQKRRLTDLSDDPDTSWRVTEQEWSFHEQYDAFASTAEHFLRRTSTGQAPWFVIPGAEPRYRSLRFGRSLLGSIRERLDQPKAPVPDDSPELSPPEVVNVLSALDQSKTVDDDTYEEELERWQGRLALACRHKRFQKRGLVVVFEGVDAAGKGGAIRRLVHALDARHYQVVPIAAPTDEERAQPYLWRFWRHLPRRGRTVVFDRSWYGRVLVERVEGYCEERDWMRGYGEINDFESDLVEHGYVVAKFWLQITQDEQLQRFRERETVPWKRFKITQEDWRNREKAAAYDAAVCDMIDRTSTSEVPWTLIPANDKNHARLAVLQALVLRLEQALGLD
jgi:polyphosphate:AMP phosphotransferase